MKFFCVKIIFCIDLSNLFETKPILCALNWCIPLENDKEDTF